MLWPWIILRSGSHFDKKMETLKFDLDTIDEFRWLGFIVFFSAQPQSCKWIIHQSPPRLLDSLHSKLCKTEAAARNMQQSGMSAFRKPGSALCWAVSDYTLSPTVSLLLCAACCLSSCSSLTLPLTSLHPLPLKYILAPYFLMFS